MARKGNVPAGRRPAPEIEAFAPGDVVRVKAASMILGMSPVELVQIGWPNEFTVLETFSKDGSPCIMLRPCCLFMRHPGNGSYLCKGHYAEHFEKVRRERPRQKGDKAASISIPWVGEVAGFEYAQDEEHPVATFRVMGKEARLEGAAAKFMKSVVESYGIKI